MKEKMKERILRYGFVLLLLVVATGATHGQYKTDPFAVRRSAIVEQIKSIKAARPNITAADLAAEANLLLEKSGIGFSISFDPATCEKLRKIKEQQKDPGAPLKLGATLKSVDADRAPLALPEPSFTSVECGGCYIELPVLQITEKDFVTVVSGRNIKFHLPGNFYVNEAVLIDDKDRSIIKKRWRIPYRSVPIGVTHDENVLYLGFEEPELSQLSLMVFGEGVFQIGTREEAEFGGKGKLIESPVTNAAAAGDQTIKFERWKNTYSVSFKAPCAAQTRP